jgi:hypothetical protein
MSAGWIAGNVRGRLMLGRRLGPEGVRSVAACGSLGTALELLQGTAYGSPDHDVVDLEDAQHVVAARTLLWLRTLAGWLPRGALETVRALGAWFELVNVENRLAYLHGSGLRAPFEVGALSTSWPRIALAQSPNELRDALRGSVWGDPGGEDPAAVHLGLRLAWARRVLGSVPEAAPWAGDALALLRAREPIDRPPNDDGALWRAEAAWWRSVEQDAEALVRGALGGRGIVVGVIALLGLDATRLDAALAVASRGGDPAAWEALDALL